MIQIHPESKSVSTSTGDIVPYDVLVLATGSDAILPTYTPGYDAEGVFVYRTISDLQNLIDFAAKHKGTVGATVGGGLLGLEAAKAMVDLQCFSSVKVIDRNEYLLARQLDSDAGNLVTEGVRKLGLDVMHGRRIASIEADERNKVTGIKFEDGERIGCSSICFAVGFVTGLISKTQRGSNMRRLGSGRGTSWPTPPAYKPASAQAAS